MLLNIHKFSGCTNPLDVRDSILVDQIVKMRVSPKRLGNPKNPGDYGMNYQRKDIVTTDMVRLSAWEILSAQLAV